MICLKCGHPILIGPGGCACTQARRHKRMMEEAAKSGERLAEMLKKEMAKPKVKAKKSTTFEHDAIDEIHAQACDFLVDLTKEAMELAQAAGSSLVTREHVEQTVKKIRRLK